MFGACQLWGKVGRAFFRPILERQYMKDMDADRMCLNAPPGEVSLRCEKKCDVVIFTDGSTCGPRKKERGRDRVGAVMFHRREYCPFQFSQVIRKDEEDPDCPHRDDRYCSRRRHLQRSLEKQRCLAAHRLRDCRSFARQGLFLEAGSMPDRGAVLGSGS